MRINVKPLSVNAAWAGKRFKTPAYKSYEQECFYLLPKLSISNPTAIHLIFGLSSMNSDWDNPIKPFQDILQKKYGFNDRTIKKATVEVIQVKKGQEYIEFELT